MADEILYLYTNRLFTGNRSQVRRWGRRLGAHFESNARAWAPVRSGELSASIYHEIVGAGKQMDILVGASADHAVYVIKGTGQWVGRSRLRNPGGKALPVGRDRAYPPKVLIANPGQVYYLKGEPHVGVGVSGQRPNNFFKLAHYLVIPKHPSTRWIDWDEVPDG